MKQVLNARDKKKGFHECDFNQIIAQTHIYVGTNFLESHRSQKKLDKGMIYAKLDSMNLFHYETSFQCWLEEKMNP